MLSGDCPRLWPKTKSGQACHIFISSPRLSATLPQWLCPDPPAIGRSAKGVSNSAQSGPWRNTEQGQTFPTDLVERGQRRVFELSYSERGTNRRSKST